MRNYFVRFAVLAAAGGVLPVLLTNQSGSPLDLLGGPLIITFLYLGHFAAVEVEPGGKLLKGQRIGARIQRSTALVSGV